MMNKMMNCGMNCCGNCGAMCCPNLPEPDLTQDYTDLRESLRGALKAVIQFLIDDVDEELEADDTAVLVLDTTGDDEVMGHQECEELYEEDYHFDDGAIEDDFGFLIAYDSSHLAQIGGEFYLIDAPLMIMEIDENGNECSVKAETIMTSRRFLKENMVELTLDDETYMAYRLSI